MSLYHSPILVTDNLEGLWDVSNIKSYNVNIGTDVLTNIAKNYLTLVGSGVSYIDSTTPVYVQSSQTFQPAHSDYVSYDKTTIIFWMRTSQQSLTTLGIDKTNQNNYFGYQYSAGIGSNNCGTPDLTVDLQSDIGYIDSTIGDGKFHMWMFDALQLRKYSWDALTVLSDTVCDLNCILYYINDSLTQQQKLQIYKMFLSRCNQQ